MEDHDGVNLESIEATLPENGDAWLAIGETSDAGGKQCVLIVSELRSIISALKESREYSAKAYRLLKCVEWTGRTVRETNACPVCRAPCDLTDPNPLHEDGCMLHALLSP